MKLNEVLENVVCNPEDIKDCFAKDANTPIHYNFMSQIKFSDRYLLRQKTFYLTMMAFITHLPWNHLCLNQEIDTFKDKLAFLLPKRAFREELTKLAIGNERYLDSDIYKKLLALGRNKVIGKPGIVVDLFEIIHFKDITELDEYWILLFHNSIISYLAGPAVSLFLALQGAIPLNTTHLELLEMIDERKKAGLDIPKKMKDYKKFMIDQRKEEMDERNKTRKSQKANTATMKQEYMEEGKLQAKVSKCSQKGNIYVN